MTRAKPLFLRLRDQAGKEAAITLIQGEDLTGEAVGGLLVVQELGDKEANRVGVIPDEEQVRLDQLKDLRLLVERAGLFGKIDHVGLKQPRQYREKKLFLGLEVPENERFAHPGGLGDLGHRGLVETACRKHRGSRAKNLVA